MQADKRTVRLAALRYVLQHAEMPPDTRSVLTEMKDELRAWQPPPPPASEPWRDVAVNDDGRRIGEAHHRARISDADVALILGLRDEKMSFSAIAAKLDHLDPPPSRSTIYSICSGRTRQQTIWGHKRVDGLPPMSVAHPDEFEFVLFT